MNLKSVRFLVFLLPALLVFSCATSQFGWQPENSNTPKQSKSSKQYVEDFDPFLLKEREIIVEPGEKIETPGYPKPNFETSNADSVSMDADEEITGYTVQLIAIGDETRAREFKREAMLKLSTDVYWIFESALYKIRTGKFRLDQRKDAEALVDEARRKGFEPWIVQTKIKVQDLTMQ